MNLIQQLEKEQFDKLAATKDIPEFGPGDTVIVNVKVVEGERTRVQAYEGVCIGRSGQGLNESFTVRKISYGEGVEHRREAGPPDRRRRVTFPSGDVTESAGPAPALFCCGIPI